MNPRTRSQWRPSIKSWLAALCTLVAACGWGTEGPLQKAPPPPGPVALPVPTVPPPTTPEPTSTPPEPELPPAAQLDVVALRLYEAASVHSSLAAGVFNYTIFDDDTLWTASSCLQLSLDGSAVVTHGIVLPTGSHTYGASFPGCIVDFLVGTSLNGATVAEYTTADRDNITARVSVSSLRGRLVAYRSDLYDVTADGSGNWSRQRAGTTWAETYQPAAGSTLANNTTTRVATFEGGSYSFFWDAAWTDSAGSRDEDFDDLRVAIGGTSYTLKGHLQIVYDRSSDRSYAGEVRITRDGALIARIYGDEHQALRTETLTPLAPF